MKEKLKAFMKYRLTVVIAGILAVISCFFVNKEIRFTGYWRLRFFLLLLCYLLTTQGMKECNMGERVSRRVLEKAGTMRGMMLRLVLLSFFLSIFLANEFVLLLIFPMALSFFSRIPNSRGSFIHALVLLTLSTSFGGMLLPFGNFQNLYLYMQYGYSVPGFFRIMFPFSLLGLLLLILLSLTFSRQGRLELSPVEQGSLLKRREFSYYLFWFLVTILLSLPLLPDLWLLPLGGVILGAVYFYDRGLFKRTDYTVLILFFFLCLLSGNIESMEGSFIWMQEKMQGIETQTALLLSQFLGNVPASVILSRFTTNGRRLIVGSNLGGLGFLWASMTGIWSIRLYGKLQHGDLKRYILHYSYVSMQLLFAMVFLAMFTGNL